MATVLTPTEPGRMLGQLAGHLQAHPELVRTSPSVYVTDRQVRINVSADNYLTWRRHCAHVSAEAIVTDADNGQERRRRSIVATVHIGDFTYILEGVSFNRTENGFKAVVGWGAFDIAKAV